MAPAAETDFDGVKSEPSAGSGARLARADKVDLSGAQSKPGAGSSDGGPSRCEPMHGQREVASMFSLSESVAASCSAVGSGFGRRRLAAQRRALVAPAV